MPFRWMVRAPDPGPPPKPEPDAVVITGDRPCAEGDCSRSDAAPCGYVDRRGRRCPTAWCPDHQRTFDGKAFCRRHEGTLRAIGLDILERSLAPDLDNRAPSLVNWICGDLDERVRAFLLDQIPPGRGIELGEELVHLVRSADGARRWDRSWKLFDHTGIIIKATISVLETEDTTVVVRVGQAPVVQSVPPWITRRIARVDIASEEDARERAGYYELLFDRICAGVRAERTGDPIHAW